MLTRLLGFTALATSLVLAAAAPGRAETDLQVRVPKTLEQVAVALSAKGYLIREIEMDDGHFEATVIDRQNIVHKAVIDGETGEIRHMKRKH
jgi:hypothetical protein